MSDRPTPTPRRGPRPAPVDADAAYITAAPAQNPHNSERVPVRQMPQASTTDRKIGTAITDRAYRIFKLAGALSDTNMRAAIEEGAELLAQHYHINL